MSNHYISYLQGPANESWSQALERFSSFCLNLHDFTDEGEIYEVFFDEYFRDGTMFEWTNPISAMELQQVEARIGFRISEDLRALFNKPFVIYDVSSDHGRWGERRVLEVYGPSSLEEYSYLQPFCSALAYTFGSYFSDKELSSEQIQHLDSNYFCFGRWSNDDEETTYLLIDQKGNFGKFFYEDGDYPENLKRLQPLLETNILTQTIDELIVPYINLSMAYLLERNDIPGCDT